MGIKFHSRLSERGDELFLIARGEDRPNIIAEVTGFLETEGLYVASISFNLTSPDHDQFTLEVVAKGDNRKLEKCHLAFEANWPLPAGAEARQSWPKIRWVRASMFHIGLNTPDRTGLVAAISKAVGASGGTFVHLLGAIDNSGDSAEGGTPYFSVRANVATESPKTTAEIISCLKQQGFGNDLWTVALDRPA
jgi:predicted amino acid-binding ACT domain protein